MALDNQVDERMARRIVDERERIPFKSVGDLSRVDARLSVALAGKAVVKGTVFRITARGVVKDAARTVQAVVRFDAAPAILSWQEL